LWEAGIGRGGCHAYGSASVQVANGGLFLRLQNACDTLEAKRKIAGEVMKIKRYKSDKAA